MALAAAPLPVNRSDRGAGNSAYLRMVWRCPSDRFNSSDSLATEGLGWQAAFPLSTEAVLSFVDGFSFLAMFWTLALGWRPGSRLPAGQSSPCHRLLVLISVLRRAVAFPLRHFGELAPGHLVLDGLDVDLVPPVVAKVEPVAEAAAHFQPQRLDGGLVHPASRRVLLAALTLVVAGQNVPGCLGVHRPFAELELVHVFVPAAKGVEDGVVQVFERLVAPKLDGAGDRRVLPGELLGDRAAEKKDLQGVEAHLALLGGLASSRRWLSRTCHTLSPFSCCRELALG